MVAGNCARVLPRVFAGVIGGAAISLVPLLGIGSAGAVRPSIVWVSPPSAKPCGEPAYPTIGDGVAAVASGGQVDVCPGTYDEDVVVTKPLTIVGYRATVDASGMTFGFAVTAPGVTVEGFVVEGANGPGIATLADHTKIIRNTATGNGLTGIFLTGSSWSTVDYNHLHSNAAGGIYLTDTSDQPTSHDTVLDNVADSNPGGCGVILADHTGAGVFDNRIVGNRVENNGTAPTSPGAGIVLASPVPGGAVYGNMIRGNTLSGNGLAGVTLHSHLPEQGDFSGNVIIGNNIGTNNLNSGSTTPGDDYGDPYTSGVFLGSVDPLTITISGNVIHNDKVGVFAAGPVTVKDLYSNSFFRVKLPLVSIPSYT